MEIIGKRFKFYVRKLKRFFNFLVRERKTRITKERTELFLVDGETYKYGSSLYEVGDNTFRFDLKNMNIRGDFYVTFYDDKVKVVYQWGDYKEDCQTFTGIKKGYKKRRENTLNLK